MCLGMKDFERGDGDTVPTMAMKGASEQQDIVGINLAKVEEVGGVRAECEMITLTKNRFVESHDGGKDGFSSQGKSGEENVGVGEGQSGRNKRAG